MRFSFVARGSRTPRRHRCQPDLEIGDRLAAALTADPGLTQAEQDAIRAFVAGWLVPSFGATQYGRPEYCQLRLAAPAADPHRRARTARRWGSTASSSSPSARATCASVSTSTSRSASRPGLIYVT